MCILRDTDQELRVVDPIPIKFYIFDCERIDVMNDYFVKYLTSINAEITAVVSNDHSIASCFPLFGCVKSLVQISVVAKSFFTDNTVESQVLIPILKRAELTDL